MGQSALLERPESGISVDELESLYYRHLVNDHTVRIGRSTPVQQFQALAHALRDLVTDRWLSTNERYDQANPKRVYYLSMEYLIGRSLWSNVVNLKAEDAVRELAFREGFDCDELIEQEPDAGLGNGGLGRLAACYIDSMATLGIPAIGYGLRYEFGIFRQDIVDGYQKESPDHWLLHHDPWEVPRSEQEVEVRLNSSLRLNWATHEHVSNQTMTLRGIPYDRPVISYGGGTVNTLRLWRATSPDYFDLQEFDTGDFVGAMLHRVAAESVTRVLYPDDETGVGRKLRFVQEVFLVSCSLADIIERFRKENSDWHALPEKVAVQLNDTHPSLAVAELMRILLDRAGLGWDDAWDLTRRTLAFTNHTLLSESLEEWAVSLFEEFLPRHLEIIYEINRRLLDEVGERYPGDDERIRRASLISESRRVRMAHLAIVGSHSTNGVAEIHSKLLRSSVFPELADMYPERFNNKTNGVTPRRWLKAANPELAGLITEAIGDAWITDLARLQDLRPLVDDGQFRDALRRVKREAKVRFSGWLRNQTGLQVDPDCIFDSQVKRIHEYKRQLLNVLGTIIRYHRLKDEPNREVPPRIVFFAGKAAPAYRLAKLIIKLINNVAAVIDADDSVRDRLKVLFLPNYGVTLAERLIPATDVSEQISTAGYEASGTGNMKFMINGALTVGTHDGATIEMAEEAGPENMFLFGLTADEVFETRGWYNPWWHYERCPETRRALDAVFSGEFCQNEPGIFEPIRQVLFDQGDRYLHLADLDAYVKTQDDVQTVYQNPDDWFRRVTHNIAASGKFSSDRAVEEYAREIWGVEPQVGYDAT